MNYQVKIQSINTVEEIKDYWSDDDYVQWESCLSRSI
jgi:hypothetical protein